MLTARLLPALENSGNSGVIFYSGPDEWQVCVQHPALAELEDGSPAPDGTPEDEAYYPCVFWDASELRSLA